MSTLAQDPTCDLDSIRYCVQSRKAWVFAAEDLVKIQYFLWMEAYKIYCREWNGWRSLHQFTNKEVGLLEVSATLLIHNIVYVYLLIINVFQEKDLSDHEAEDEGDEDDEDNKKASVKKSGVTETVENEDEIEVC